MLKAHESEYCSLLASQLRFIVKDKYDVLVLKLNERYRNNPVNREIFSFSLDGKRNKKIKPIRS